MEIGTGRVRLSNKSKEDKDIEYRTAIVDECGIIMAWCSDLTGEQEQEMMDNHPEWSYRCVEM